MLTDEYHRNIRDVSAYRGINIKVSTLKMTISSYEKLFILFTFIQFTFVAYQ